VNSNYDIIIQNSKFIENQGYSKFIFYNYNIDGLIKYTKTFLGGITFVDCLFSGNKGESARVFALENNLINEFKVIRSTFTSN